MLYHAEPFSAIIMPSFARCIVPRGTVCCNVLVRVKFVLNGSAMFWCGVPRGTVQKVGIFARLHCFGAVLQCFGAVLHCFGAWCVVRGAALFLCGVALFLCV